ncbi:hypothetical protein GCM10022226_74590 [Sphaerisporangium flaviroseum]|uniref:Uncharacterized protein n=1 Tax=Sphaerisporangium flaviroseum TaxID=509199 RepID=A0ABP7JDS6_9ACTN
MRVSLQLTKPIVNRLLLEEKFKKHGSYAHRTVLVGASVRPGDDLFLTVDHDLYLGQSPLMPAEIGIDHESAVGPGNLEDRLDDSDDALIGAARTQMLAYLALRSAPASQLRTVPVSADRASRHRRSGLTTPLEDDDLTRGMRAEARGVATYTERMASANRTALRASARWPRCHAPSGRSSR